MFLRALQACSLLSLVAALGAPGNGLGEAYTWTPWKEAKALAAEQNKPIMLVIHKTWCGACKNLKPLFAESKAIQREAGAFILVNTQDDEEPGESMFKPDGGYIPRILFLNPAGEVMTDVFNAAGNPKYKYYYTDGESIATAMHTAATKIAGSARFESNDKAEL